MEQLEPSHFTAGCTKQSITEETTQHIPKSEPDLAVLPVFS
jgi:hypothetical protein